MPSPIGHSLAGYAVAESIDPNLHRRWWATIALIVVVSNLPDFDFLPGLLLGTPHRFHRKASHSVAAAMLVAGVGGIVYRMLTGRSVSRASTCIGLIYFSHILLDLLAPDTHGARGLQLFWPLSREYFAFTIPISPELFELEKSSDPSEFIPSLFRWSNLFVVAAETAVLLPIAVGARWLGRKRTRRG